MFKPCPNCGFLVALIAGREASQRCPRCGSALVASDATDAAPAGPAPAHAPVPDAERAAPSAAAASPPAHAAGRAMRDAAPAPPGAHARVRDLPPPDARAERSARGDDAASLRIVSDGPLGGPADPAAAPMSGAAAVARAEPANDPAPGRDATTPAQPAPLPAADTPAFVRGRGMPRRAGRRWPGLLALGLLAALLTLQLLLAQREALAQDARWRPVVARACALFGCRLPPWREPAAFAMLARNVRPHPTRADVLRVTATVRNGAEWPQPLPVVVLSLSDVDGRVVGAQAVPPASYSRQPGMLVMPGASADIAFDVREPASKVVSFAFDLR